MLQIKNLHASIEDKDILKGINLEIKAGEVHAIMGPNGSGKSTLSSIIAGNENYEVSQGEIYLNGEEISDLAPEERAHKGVFLSFQYPVEIPGVSTTNFMKAAVNEKRNIQYYISPTTSYTKTFHESHLQRGNNKRTKVTNLQFGIFYV